VLILESGDPIPQPLNRLMTYRTNPVRSRKIQKNKPNQRRKLARYRAGVLAKGTNWS